MLTPFVIGAVLAYALHPAVEQLARAPRAAPARGGRWSRSRRWSRVAALVLLIVPILSKELPLLNEQLPLLAERINRAVSPWLAQMGIHVSLDPASLRDVPDQVPRRQLGRGLAAALSLGAHRRQHRRSPSSAT